MKPSVVKREYQKQQWHGMLQKQQESGMTIRAWCAENGVSEHAFYYRLRKSRAAACAALEQAQGCQLAEVPLAPREETQPPKIRILTASGTVEVSDVGAELIERILRVMIHAEK